MSSGSCGFITFLGKIFIYSLTFGTGAAALYFWKEKNKLTQAIEYYEGKNLQFPFDTSSLVLTALVLAEINIVSIRY